MNNNSTYNRSLSESLQHTRRDFIRSMPLAGLGVFGIGYFIQSCAEKGITLTNELTKHYIEGIREIIKTVKERELDNIKQASALVVNTRLLGHDTYASLKGGMFPYEIDNNRPGSPHIFTFDNIHNASKGDVIVTNDPVIVRGFSERMVKIIGITSPSVLNKDTPSGTLENMGTFRIEDFSDIVIHCHVPYTDGILHVEGIDIPICPVSGIIHSIIYYSLAAEIVTSLAESGIYPKIS